MTTSDLVKEMCQKHGISKSNDLSLTIILTHRGRKKTKSFLKVGKVEKCGKNGLEKLKKHGQNRLEKLKKCGKNGLEKLKSNCIIKLKKV